MLDKIRENRIKKLQNLKNNGIDPYPSQVGKFHFISEILPNFIKFVKAKKKIAVVGRIMIIRNFGGVIFVQLNDGTGKIQLMFRKENLKDKFKFFTENFDMGDFIYAKGKAMFTKTKEKTIFVDEFKILSKSILPLPEKWHGLKDIEDRSRYRYLDLIMNQESKEKFIKRFNLIRVIREVLNKEGFLEVETPILQVLAGGALAKPFKTYLNALDVDLYLRIAPELYLKRLLIAGFNKIYEIGKCFRNEGMDKDHNPEFTMIEGYIAYVNYEFLMSFINKFLQRVIKIINKNLILNYDGKKINLVGKWAQIDFNNALKKYAGVDFFKDSRDILFKKLKDSGYEIDKLATKENIADEIFKKICRPQIINPTFITGHPRDLSPLAKINKINSEKVERFQLIIAGMELVNAYSELNDPIDQEFRFIEHSKKAKSDKDGDFHCFDKEFVKSLEYGMPPAAGFGIGLDRLTMLLTDTHNVRDIILFPFMRPE